MGKLVDYSWARPGGAALKAAGYTGALRYLSSSVGKNLSASEAKDLHDNEIAIGLVWEDSANAPLLGFNQGVTDAKKALSEANSLGFPASLPIYFACDFDSTPAQQVEIDAYLKGCASIIGSSRVGVYGSFYVIERCAANGTAAWFWQTLAWSGGQISAHCHIYQNGKSAFGGGCDVDEAKQENWGQWIPAVAVVEAPIPAPIVPEPAPAPEVPITEPEPIVEAPVVPEIPAETIPTTVVDVPAVQEQIVQQIVDNLPPTFWQKLWAKIKTFLPWI